MGNPMTLARFTAAELSAAAEVANKHRAVIRLERNGAVAEVKPVDLDRDKGQRQGEPEPW